MLTPCSIFCSIVLQSNTATTKKLILAHPNHENSIATLRGCNSVGLECLSVEQEVASMSYRTRSANKGFKTIKSMQVDFACVVAVIKRRILLKHPLRNNAALFIAVYFGNGQNYLYHI